jgi:hypothetical protein
MGDVHVFADEFEAPPQSDVVRVHPVYHAHFRQGRGACH